MILPHSIGKPPGFIARESTSRRLGLLEQALTLAERVLGKEHRGTLAIINNLATLYYAQGRYR
jgi:hypothetical protein